MTFAVSKQPPAGWDEAVGASPGGGAFFQLEEFARIKAKAGWSPRYLSSPTQSLLVLQRFVPPLGFLWYIPQGPTGSADDVLAALPQIKQAAKKHKVFAVKFEPLVEDSPEFDAALVKAGAERSTNVQPTFSTIWIDLRPDEDALLKGFDSKARYNIRRAIKDGVTVEEVPINAENCATFYSLFAKTAEGRFVIRPQEYYDRFWTTYGDAGKGVFFFAYYEGEVISADFVMVNGTQANRKDAASAPIKTVRGAAALVVFETCKWLKERGVTDYDLCGSPHSDHIKDESDALYGVGQFKTGFNKDITDYSGTLLLPVWPLQARAWQASVEKAVRKAHFVVKKTPYF